MKKKYVFLLIFITMCNSVAHAESPKDPNTGVVGPDSEAIWDNVLDVLDEMFYPDEMMKYEIGYSYSSIAPVNTLFPVGIYGEWAYDWIAVSAEIAANFSNKTYPMPKNENVTYDPILYGMLGVGVNFNCLSINFNAGVADYSYTSTKSTEVVTDDISMSLTTSATSSKVVAILQPSIHIHIPVNEFEHFISLKIGYNICPSLKDFNGLNIGIGFGGWLDY